MRKWNQQRMENRFNFMYEKFLIPKKEIVKKSAMWSIKVL